MQSSGSRIEMGPVQTTIFDPVLKQAIQQLRIEPVLINYTVGSTRYEKVPDDDDRRILSVAGDLLSTRGLPAITLINAKETQRNVPIGVTHLHQFFTAREHLFVAALLDQIRQYPDSNVRQTLLLPLLCHIHHECGVFAPTGKAEDPCLGLFMSAH
jgi:hypothetical protein